MNNELKERLNKNIEFSKQLCDILNKFIKENNIKYIPFATTENIGVKQVLDKRGLQYNEMSFDDRIIGAGTLEEIKELIYRNLGRGLFTPIYPTTKEIELYDKLKEYKWDIVMDEGVLYYNYDGVGIEDIISSYITKDIIKLEVDEYNYDCSWIVIKYSKDGKSLDIEYIK